MIAKEGWKIILAGLIASLIFYKLFNMPVLGFIALLFTVFSLQFFRDPARLIIDDVDAILSPADGQVVHIGQTLNPYTNTQAMKVSVFMNVFNVHSNRIPMAGTVKQVNYFAGSFLNAALDKASLENERNAVIITNKDQIDITFVQIAGLVARRILCYVQPGQQVQAGERYGFIRFGSRVDVYLPLGTLINVQLGQKVKATETILAKLSTPKLLSE